jgi:DNA-binding Lrp family transcriptional regulator
MAILSIEMYYAHLRGASIESISEKLGYSEEWVTERLEAARLSLEKQVVICAASAFATANACGRV